MLRSYACPVVALELAAHLVGPDRDLASRGLAAMFEHCRNEDSATMRWVADSDSTICQAIYGRRPQSNEESVQVLGVVCRNLWMGADASESSGILSVAAQAEEHVRAGEEQFADDVLAHVVTQLDGNVRSWTELNTRHDLKDAARSYMHSSEFRRDFAEVLTRRAATLLGESQAPDDICRHAVRADGLFPIALRLYGHALLKIVVDGVRLDRNSKTNWWWDVSHCTYPGLKLQDQSELYLVTDDRDIANAAREADQSQYVLDRSYLSVQ